MLSLPSTLLGAVLAAAAARAQVTATGTMGPTNPPEATLGTPVNQSSTARLISLNAIDDFCLFAPPVPNSIIGDTETEEVAWCVQPRNNARVIPDGTLQGVHFVKTPMYWQIQGWGDFTKLNIAAGDTGGELDPHGATGLGNPIGGNVTTNATGSDVHYEEWMNYMSSYSFCLRICISENATYSAASMCQHQLDVMGCQWVMPGDYTNGTFTECDSDPAYPPGVYPEPGGEFSTFAQRWTGTITQTNGVFTYTVGQTVTPSAPAMTPKSSNCKTYTSVGNGIPPAALSANAEFTYTPGMSFSLPPSATASAGADAAAGSGSGSGSGSNAAATSGTSAGGAAPTTSPHSAARAAAPLSAHLLAGAGVASVVAILGGAASLFI